MTTTWNSGDKTANVTLSGGNLTAITTSASSGGVRSSASKASGKYYVEFYLLSTPSGNISVGWANATASLSANIGADTNSIAYLPGGGTLFLNNSTLAFVEPAPLISTVCVAFDITNLLIWVKINASLWNASVSADPGAGFGGISVAILSAGPYFPVFGANVNGASVSVNFGAMDFNYTAPAGFSAFDSDSQAYNAASKFLGYADMSPPKTVGSASKFIGYDQLAPSQTCAVASKFVGYAVLLNGVSYSQGCVIG